MAAEPDHHTIPEKLLLAAAEVAAKRSTWPIEQLIEHAWRKWPETFGLRGYELKHPNANIVISAMSGKKGLVGRGCFERIMPNVYKLTQDGLDAIKMIKEGLGSPKYKRVCKKELDVLKAKQFNPLVLSLQNTVAYREDLSGARIGINFVEAQKFFNGCNRKDILNQLTMIGESDKPESGEARALRGLADYLCERFAQAWEIHEKIQVKT